MKKYTRSYLQLLISLIAILQLIACASNSQTYRERIQIDIWDMSNVRKIAIVPQTTLPSYYFSGTDERNLEQFLCAYIGTEAKKIFEETKKFTIVSDSKDADAILNCDVISVLIEKSSHPFSNSLGNYDEYTYSVIYNIFLVRTSDGSIIGDCAGQGSDYYRSVSNYKYVPYSNLINMNHLRQALELPVNSRYQFYKLP